MSKSLLVLFLSLAASTTMAASTNLVGSWMATTQSCLKGGHLSEDVEHVQKRAQLMDFHADGTADLKIFDSPQVGIGPAVVFFAKYAILDNYLIWSARKGTTDDASVVFDPTPKVYQFLVKNNQLRIFSSNQNPSGVLVSRECQSADTEVTTLRKVN